MKVNIIVFRLTINFPRVKAMYYLLLPKEMRLYGENKHTTVAWKTDLKIMNVLFNFFFSLFGLVGTYIAPKMPDGLAGVHFQLYFTSF